MNFDELMGRALETLSLAGMDENWLDLGCETKSQNRLNREYMDSLVFETRLIDARQSDLSTELFGVPLQSPVVASTLSRSRVLEKLQHEAVAWYESAPYLEHIAQALGAAGSLMGIGVVDDLEELGSLVRQGAPVYHIVKPMPDEAKVLEHLKAAQEAGCIAVGMDITPSFGHKAWNETPSSDRDTEPKSREQLRSYVEATSLPFIVKGVLSVTDALAAQQVGAAAIVVSNHGGECIDYSVPVLRVLPEIRDAVGDEMTVLVDSGFRRGTDILKALCLGANAVGIVTPLIVGYAAAGKYGVQAMFDVLTSELRRTMSSVGLVDVASIDGTVLHQFHTFAQSGRSGQEALG